MAAIVMGRPFYFTNLVSSSSSSDSFFLLVALWNRADHYIVMLLFVLSFFLSFFSSPNLSGRRLDIYHTLAHGVALVRI